MTDVIDVQRLPETDQGSFRPLSITPQRESSKSFRHRVAIHNDLVGASEFRSKNIGHGFTDPIQVGVLRGVMQRKDQNRSWLRPRGKKQKAAEKVEAAKTHASMLTVRTYGEIGAE
jgi:hypothetical protein